MTENDAVMCVILGGGGHARMLIDAVQAGESRVSLYAVLDPDQSRWGESIYGVPIRGDDSLIPELIAQGVNAFAVGIGSVGNASARRRLYRLGIEHQLNPVNIIHPRAIVSPNATLGQGVQVMPGSIINAGALIGENVIINSGAIVEHDCIIEDHVHIATGARLSGTVHIAEGAHVGAGAVVRQGIYVGVNAIVGVGAAVISHVPPDMTVVGVPAHPLERS